MVTEKYVAFCDILGFSKKVLDNFEETLNLYTIFKDEISSFPYSEKVEVSIYSDSILIVGDELASVLQTAQLLSFFTLSNGLLLRGGIAKGKYWKESDEKNLFIVSEALIKAVDIEKQVKYPAIAISKDIDITFEFWMPYFEHGSFISPILYYDNIIMINPFNQFWFNSAEIHVLDMLEANPQYEEKYSWFLHLVKLVRDNECLVPPNIIEKLIELKLIEKIE